MLQRDSQADRRFGRFRITLPRPPYRLRRREKLRDRSQGRLFQENGTMRHPHFARDVQVVAGI